MLVLDETATEKALSMAGLIAALRAARLVFNSFTSSSAS